MLEMVCYPQHCIKDCASVMHRSQNSAILKIWLMNGSSVHNIEQVIECTSVKVNDTIGAGPIERSDHSLLKLNNT